MWQNHNIAPALYQGPFQNLPEPISQHAKFKKGVLSVECAHILKRRLEIQVFLWLWYTFLC